MVAVSDLVDRMGSPDDRINYKPIAETERIVELLKDAGNTSIQFTVYEGAGHVAAWEKAYGNPDVWDWLFSQKRRTVDQ